MKCQDRWRRSAAQVIYRAYPDYDLLPIDPPQPGETSSAFAVRAQEAGDTLFLFLCREAHDAMDAREYLAQLDRAILDIEHVRAAFVQQRDAAAGTSKRRPRSARPGAAH